MTIPIRFSYIYQTITRQLPSHPPGPQKLVSSMTIDRLYMRPENDTSIALVLNTTVGIIDILGNHSKMDIQEVSLTTQALGLDGSSLGVITTGNPPPPPQMCQV